MARQHHENFPVASLLLPASARKAVLALYHFARGADDIADNPDATVAERSTGLQQLDAAFTGHSQEVPAWAAAYLALCCSGRCDAQDGRDLLHAFLLDQQVTRCPNWEAMLSYCQYSAVPVGRSFLNLCGESAADKEALAALCICLQLINHLQDIGHDYRVLGRIYLPSDWLQEAGATEAELAALHASPAVRVVIQRVLEAMCPLLEQAACLPQSVRSRRLALELRWVIEIVRQLHQRLGQEDPLAARITPGIRGKLEALIKALCAGTGNRSNFYWPMRLAGKERGQALVALHRFLRAIDRTADDELGDVARMDKWRKECAALANGHATTPQGQALLPYIPRYGLEVGLLHEVVEGCVMDVQGVMHTPPADLLHLYCERVAVAPGKLVLAILGWQGAQASALADALGHAFQRTNILRDVQADKQQGRSYFALSEREAFIRKTTQYYAQAAAILAQLPRGELLTVKLMRDVYWRVFCRVCEQPRSLPRLNVPTLPFLLWRCLGYRLGLMA